MYVAGKNWKVTLLFEHPSYLYGWDTSTQYASRHGVTQILSVAGLLERVSDEYSSALFIIYGGGESGRIVHSPETIQFL